MEGFREHPLKTAAKPSNCCPDNILDFGFKSKEDEVHNLEMELCKMQRERMQLIQQRNLLSCSNPCSPCPSFGQNSLTKHLSSMDVHKSCRPSSPKASKETAMYMEQLRDLRQQYCHLQEDHRNKVCEVSCLRTELEKLRCELKESESCRKKQECTLTSIEKKMKAMEAERDSLFGTREKLIEQEQALIVAKHRFSEVQDELDEMRVNLQDQVRQTDDYRKKYLQAQQVVEEQKRQLDLMEMDNARINENVTLEINRIKSQFQEKLMELAPLPEVLKKTQMKLQESKKEQCLLEQTCDELNQEIACYKEKVESLNLLIENHANEKAELESKMKTFCELQEQVTELTAENERLKSCATEIEEMKKQFDKRMDEKLHEIAQLQAMMEQIREDSARLVARTKEKAEIMRQSMQNEICELEKEIVQCKAVTRSVVKDRDEIRQKIQNQLDSITASFTQVQGRLNLLQGHVNYLKDSPPETNPNQNHDLPCESCNSSY